MNIDGEGLELSMISLPENHILKAEIYLFIGAASSSLGTFSGEKNIKAEICKLQPFREWIPIRINVKSLYQDDLGSDQ